MVDDIDFIPGMVIWWMVDDLFFLPLWEMSSEMLSHWMNTFSGRYSMLEKRKRSGT